MTADEPCHSSGTLLSTSLVFARKVLGDADYRVLILANILIGVAYSFVLPFMSVFGTRGVGLGPVGLGAFMTATSLGAIACSTVLARWSDVMLARRTVLLLGGVAGCLGYLGYAFIRSVPWLVLNGVVVLGIASITFSQLFAYARDLLTRRGVVAKDVPLYMNVFRLCFALSWTVGPAVAAWLMTLADFRGLFLVASGFFALFVLLVVVGIPNLLPSEATRQQALAMPLRRAWRTPGLVRHFLAFTLYFACSALAMVNLPLLLLEALGGAPRDIGIAYSIAPVFELPLMLLTGALAARFPARKLILGALLLASVYYAVLSMVQQPWQAFPAQVLSAAIVAVTSGVAITFFQDFLPGQPGTATNLYATAQRIGSTTGYLCFGLLTSSFGARGVFTCCALVCAAAAALLATGRRKALQ